MSLRLLGQEVPVQRRDVLKLQGDQSCGPGRRRAGAAPVAGLRPR